MAECCICLEDMTDRQDVIMTECCKNELHKACLDKSASIFRCCPLCRKQLIITDVEAGREVVATTRHPLLRILTYVFYLAIGTCFLGILLVMFATSGVLH